MTAVSYWTAATMALAAASLYCPAVQGGVNFCDVETVCSQDVDIPVDELCDVITVYLRSPFVMFSGARCSWILPALNSTMRYNVVEALPTELRPGVESGTSACDPDVFQLWEHDPANNSVQNPLPVSCYGSNEVSTYGTAFSQLGSSLSILLNVSSPLPQSFGVLRIMPLVWTEDTCPSNTSKVLAAPHGSNHDKEELTFLDQLSYGLPPNLACHWEINDSSDGNLLMLNIDNNGFSSNTCSSRFLLSDDEGSPNPVTVPLCTGEDVHFDYTSTTGSVFVQYQSGSSSVTPVWTVSYWSADACPQTPLVLYAYPHSTEVLSGLSFSSRDARHEQHCAWQIVTDAFHIVKVTLLDAGDFQQDCDNATDRDYLILNGEKLGMCDDSKLPIFSEDYFMDVSFHTYSQAARRSFGLRYTAVVKTACQGQPLGVNVTGLQHNGQEVTLYHTQQGDEEVCQWLFTASDEDKVIQVKVSWADTTYSMYGVPFDRNTCSYDRFDAYPGNITNSSAAITPTCTADKPAIVYTSVSREMLFVFRKGDDRTFFGLRMEVSQIVDRAASGGMSNFGLFAAWKIIFLGFLASVLVQC